MGHRRKDQIQRQPVRCVYRVPSSCSLSSVGSYHRRRGTVNRIPVVRHWRDLRCPKPSRANPAAAGEESSLSRLVLSRLCCWRRETWKCFHGTAESPGIPFVAFRVERTPTEARRNTTAGYVSLRWSPRMLLAPIQQSGNGVGQA